MPRARLAASLLAPLIGLHLLLPPALQAAAKTFRQASAKDFEEGEAEGTTILPTGELVPGLVGTRIGVDAAFVWCSVASRDGGTGYFGTGDEGKIFARALGGKGASDKTAARPLATLDAAWVTALATRADGTLLAGATPGGKLYVVEPQSSKTPGATKLLATLAAAHVWAVVRDDKAALTYVGTGSPGKVFAVDDKGHAREVWDAHDKHVVSLVRDSDGTLLAGTSEDAILYRIKPDGHATALQDFEAEEVRAIVRAPSGLYVAVNDFEKTPAPPALGPAPAKGTKIVLATGGPPPSAGTLPRPGQRKAKSAVYRLESDGRTEQVFALPDGYLTALAVTDDGAVLAASGTQGHVYRITAERTSSLVIDVPERQALTLLRAGSDVWVGTGDSGGLYRANAPADNGARYLSKVFDAEYPARWGTLRWQGNDVTFETRSGNTAKPDAGWSGWQGTGSKPGDGSGGAGAVSSPPARYLQYQARLAPRKGRLRGVTTYYLPQNQRARVTELTLADAAPALATGATAATTPRAAKSPILKLRWKVENADGDELIYRLHFRLQSEGIWRPLAGVLGEPLTKPEYDWNTEGVPDGLYVVHVTASDERAQPGERALSSGFDSAPLLVDNRRPIIRDLKGKYPSIDGRAQDDASPISLLEFSVDGGDWQPLSPSDGIADEPTEAFTIRLPKLARGPHTVVVRATDSADNVGAADLVIGAP